MANCSRLLKKLIVEYWEVYEEAANAVWLFNLAPTMKHRIRKVAKIEKMISLSQEIHLEARGDSQVSAALPRLIKGIQEFANDFDADA